MSTVTDLLSEACFAILEYQQTGKMEATPKDLPERLRKFISEASGDVQPAHPKPQRLRLWRSTFSSSAYVDQATRKHDGYIVTGEVDVTIVERKAAKGMWSQRMSEGMAVRAVDAEGHEYFCNWDGVFADDTPTPMWLWADKWEAARVVAFFPCFYPDGRRASPDPDTPGLNSAPTVAVDRAVGPDGTMTVLYWMGRPVASLNREELIEAINVLAQMVNDIREQADRERKFLLGMTRR